MRLGKKYKQNTITYAEAEKVLSCIVTRLMNVLIIMEI